MLSVMKKEDILSTAVLFTGVYTSAPWYHTNVTVEKAVRYIRDLMRTPGFLGFVYQQEGQCLGMVLGTVSDYFFEPQYKIEELAVVPAFHRQGIGTKILAALEDSLRKRGVAFVMLQTSNGLPAYDFYIKNGYTNVPKNLCMAKAL